MEKIGLYGGAFNPIHNGHMNVANYMLSFTDIDEVLFIVSPQNPTKTSDSLLPENERYNMVRMATQKINNFSYSDIEFNMERPSYSHKTIKKLKDDNPQNEYVLIIGSDNLHQLKEWKNYVWILENIQIYVYKRDNLLHNVNFAPINANIKYHYDVPTSSISSTFIRESIENGKNIDTFLPESVAYYIDTFDFYKKKVYDGRN